MNTAETVSKEMYQRWRIVAFFWFNFVRMVRAHGSEHGSVVRITFAHLLWHYMNRPKNPAEKVLPKSERIPPDELFKDQMTVQEAIAKIGLHFEDKDQVWENARERVAKYAMFGIFVLIAGTVVSAGIGRIELVSGLLHSGVFPPLAILVLFAGAGAYQEFRDSKIREKELLNIIMPTTYYQLVSLAKILRVLDPKIASNPSWHLSTQADDFTVGTLSHLVKRTILTYAMWVYGRQTEKESHFDESIPRTRKILQEFVLEAYRVGLIEAGDTDMKPWFDRAKTEITNGPGDGSKKSDYYSGHMAFREVEPGPIFDSWPNQSVE